MNISKLYIISCNKFMISFIICSCNDNLVFDIIMSSWNARRLSFYI